MTSLMLITVEGESQIPNVGLEMVVFFVLDGINKSPHKYFVDVDGTTIITQKSTYASNGIDIAEMNSVGNDILAAHYVFVSVRCTMRIY